MSKQYDLIIEVDGLGSRYFKPITERGANFIAWAIHSDDIMHQLESSNISFRVVSCAPVRVNSNDLNHIINKGEKNV